MTEKKRTILVVEDESSIMKFLVASLTNQNFDVLKAFTAEQGLSQAFLHKPHIILLDMGLPDMDGLEVIKRLRQWGDIPIIVITARMGEGDKVTGLDAGADDYLTKPFNVGELMARIRVALRHAEHAEHGPKELVFENKDLRVDLGGRTVYVKGKEVHLTPIEYDLLAFFIHHAGKVVTQKQILKEIWGTANDEQGGHLRIYIHHLRQKIETDPNRPRCVITEPGVGYRLK